MKFGSLIDYGLFNSKSSLPILLPLMKRNARKQFGILESPANSSSIYDGVVPYKIFVSGKSLTGKTSMILKLLGKKYLESRPETLGIEISVIYWPVKIVETEKIVLFKLVFWDAGESYLNSYSHILPSCLEDTDCVLHLFSLTNKSSWEALPKLITKIDVSGEVLQVCVGTQFDQGSLSEISFNSTKDFEEAWKFPVLTIKNIGDRCGDFKSPFDAFNDVSPFMNRLCELLWYKDQIKAGLIQNSLVDYCFSDEGREYGFITKEVIDKQTRVTFC